MRGRGERGFGTGGSRGSRSYYFGGQKKKKEEIGNGHCGEGYRKGGLRGHRIGKGDKKQGNGPMG